MAENNKEEVEVSETKDKTENSLLEAVQWVGLIVVLLWIGFLLGLSFYNQSP